HWLIQKAMGVTVIPSNDFSLYDRVLYAAVMVGASPQGYGWNWAAVSLGTYFSMARGSQCMPAGCCHAEGEGVPALEMTKWFDTNYYYLVPEFSPDQEFRLASTKPLDEFNEAKALGIHTRPMHVGPVSFLKLGKRTDVGDPLALLPRLVPVYAELLRRLPEAGAAWVQMDEPCL